MFVELGEKRENNIFCDSKGPIYEGREGKLDGRKARYVSKTEARSLEEAMMGADVFLGVSKAGLVTAEMVKSMADKPLILALANPVPEIMPDEVHAVREDAIVATGRSDFPNQVNNVLCFPYLFRGALDVGATTINEEMKMAAVYALADLAKSPAGEEVMAAYGGQQLTYGSEYVIPKPFDSRLISTLPVEVAKAAMKSGVATRPIEDLESYRLRLEGLLNRSGFVMRPIMDKAKANPLRVAFAEGEQLKVLRAVQASIQEGICKPIVIGRRETIERRIEKYNLSLTPDEDFELIEPMNNPYYDECWQTYHEIRAREGVDPNDARIHLNTRPTVLAAMLVRLGYADTLICGTIGRYDRHLRRVRSVLGTKPEMTSPAAMNMMISPKGTIFIADTHVHREPSAEELTGITIMAAQKMQRLGVHPKVALVSRSSFGECGDMRSSQEMRKALAMIKERAPDLEIDGEMQADAALAEEVRSVVFPENNLKGNANLLVMPNLDSANIAYNLMKVLIDGNVVGPILFGLKRPGQVLTKVATTRRIVNMVAVAVVEAQAHYQMLKQND